MNVDYIWLQVCILITLLFVCVSLYIFKFFWIRVRFSELKPRVRNNLKGGNSLTNHTEWDFWNSRYTLRSRKVAEIEKPLDAETIAVLGIGLSKSANRFKNIIHGWLDILKELKKMFTCIFLHYYWFFEKVRHSYLKIWLVRVDLLIFVVDG